MIVSTTDVTLPKSLDSIEWEVREDGDRAREDCQSASLKRNQLSGERSVTKWDLDDSVRFLYIFDLQEIQRRRQGDTPGPTMICLDRNGQTKTCPRIPLNWN